MLAAVPTEQTRVLELFSLALSMVGAGRRDIPLPLASYFNNVLEQARRLASEPAAVHGQILPEAIQLALDLRNVAAIRDAMNGVRSIDMISPEQAQKALESLERSVEA